jgi:hypothetical protein
MSDPAWGRSKTERALGEFTPKKKQSPKGEKALKPVRSRLNEFRVVHVGQYDGPRASYGRYNVSEQSADILNRSKRNMDMR